MTLSVPSPSRSPKLRAVSVWIIALLFLPALIAIESVALHGYAQTAPGTADFFARWYGATELIQRGRNPYDREIELEAQKILFGRPTHPDEDQVNFAYPLYVIYLFWPLTFAPYDWAQAIWMTVLQFALIGGTLLLFPLFRWRPPPLYFALTVLWSVLFYPGARAIMLGQFSIIVFLSLAIALWGLATGRDRLAGAVLPLATIKPQMIFLIIPFILLWAWQQKRHQFLLAFGICAAILALTSILWVPQWPLQFLTNLNAYSGYVGHGSPLENMTARFVPGLDQWLNPLITVLLVGLMLWLWAQALFKQPESFLWVAIWTLLISNLVAFRSATTNHVTLYLALFLLFKRLSPAGKSAWRVLLFQLAAAVGLWTLFFNTIDHARGSNFEAIFMHGLMPALLTAWFLLDWTALKSLAPPFKTTDHAQ